MKNRLVNGVLAAVVLLGSGCDSRKQISKSFNRQEKAIDKPIKQIETHIDVLTINPDSGGEFQLKTGTVVKIPKDAFVDTKGNLIKEPVKIEMQEFHSAAEIFLSGITMHYEQNGESVPFESAGMFRIDGTCNGNSIEVASGKSIEVELASKTDESDYDFFQLDPKTANWEKIGTTDASINQDKKALADTIEQIKASKFTSNVPTFAKEGAVVLDLNIDYRKYSQLKDFYGLAWQVESTESADEIVNSNWEYIDLISNGAGINDFSLKLMRGEESKEVKVQPVVSKEERRRLEKKYAIALEEEEKARALAMQNVRLRMESLSNFQRNLSVSGFGVYNCDRAIKFKEPLALKPKFILNGEELKTIPLYYVISNDNSAVSQYSNSFKIDRTRNSRLVFVLGDGYVAYATNQQLMSLATQTQNGNELARLDLYQFGQRIETPEDFSELLKRI
ncbi:MAG: hypothetical protein WED33_11080 [Bacteroidia bacterium]